ncbi:hypothetical protein [Leucobacter sp. L43]|uniref:hypothetical protein n=1 Tax=Leucobacter sp. L43 TaxID=2798040 RepID=UPI0019084CB6|nr:hypothetical protein [Leucobacter sp. L43]
MNDSRGEHSRSGASSADPTRVTQQPALTTASGTIWVVMGSLLLVAGAVPVVAIIALRPGPMVPVAVATGALMLACTCVLFIARFAVQRGPRRLRVMAASMIASAVVGVLGLLLCLVIQGS